MNKSDLIDFISSKISADVPKSLVTEIVDLAFGGIAATLKKGEEARFAGFGTFKTGRSKARTGRNPRTGETIKIEASTRVKFTAGKELKEAVNQ